MAESAAFTANLQYHPSIFEITASEFLDNILYPALSKICNFLGWKFNINWKHFKISDDISPVISFALQYFYLRKRNASFGESFYSLERTTTNDKPFEKRLNSALLLLLIPYLEKKLKTRAADHENQNIIENFLLNGLHFLRIVKAVNVLAYLSKMSSTHSPILKMLSLKLSYSQSPEENTTSIIVKSIELFAFFLQFMQWWYSQNGRKNIGKLKNPPCLKNKEMNLIISNTKDKCPICLQKISIPTASSMSGYVYCYKCVASHLKNRKSCPVTGLPMNIEDLVRVYDS